MACVSRRLGRPTTSHIDLIPINGNAKPIRSYCLSKSQRLRKPAEFRFVYQSKHWGSNDLFSFSAAPTEGKTRLGVTVSKKVAKQAVQRNRLKRLVREHFRHRQHQLPATDLIITARPASAQKTSAQIATSLDNLWIKVLKWRQWYERV